MSFIKTDKVKGVLEALKALTGKQVLIGITEGTESREDGPINNASLGYIHETGSPINNIPARPWLVPGVESKKPQLAALLKASATAALEGNSIKSDAKLNQAGLEGQSSAQEKIRNGPFTELAEKTLQARRRRGVTREKPLIDTGKLLASVTYVIRKK